MQTMRLATRVLLGLVVLAAWMLADRGQAGAVQSATTGQIAAAFHQLEMLPKVAQGRPYLQGYDAAMRSELQQAGTHLLEGIGKPVTVRYSTGPVDMAGPGEAEVQLTINVKAKDPPPSFSDSFDAVALRVGGHWKVAWTTMCLLVESTQQLCPPTRGASWRGTSFRQPGAPTSQLRTRARRVSSIQGRSPWRPTGAC